MRTLLSITLGLIVASSMPAQKAIPHTPDGHPDLQGVWTNATITPLERPAALAGKPPEPMPKPERTNRRRQPVEHARQRCQQRF